MIVLILYIQNFCEMKIEYIMHIAQDYRVLYNNAVSLAICEGWHFTHSLVGETGILGKNHQPAASHWQTLSHNVESSTPCH